MRKICVNAQQFFSSILKCEGHLIFRYFFRKACRLAELAGFFWLALQQAFSVLLQLSSDLLLYTNHLSLW